MMMTMMTTGIKNILIREDFKVNYFYRNSRDEED